MLELDISKIPKSVVAFTKKKIDVINDKVLVPYLKRLEGKAYVVALSYSNFPHAHFVGPVVIRVVGGLDLAVVFLHLPTTDGYM